MSENCRHRQVTTIILLLPLIGTAVGAGVRPDEHFPIAMCDKGALAPAVERLVKPVLLARVAWARSRSYLDKDFETAFYKFLEAKGAVALEAKVALMAYYTGEHYGEELVEAVLEHPAQADSLVRRYRDCRPRVTFEDQLDGLVVLRTQYDNYDYIRAQAK